MAYDEGLAQRVRDAMPPGVACEEKKMFGGLCFLVRGSMALGIVKNELMVRVGPDGHEASLAMPHVREMDFTGRPMKGMIYVAPEGLAAASDMEHWVNQALAFNRTQPVKKK